MPDTTTMTMLDLARAVASRGVSASEAARTALARLAAVDRGLGAFLQTFESRAMARAATIDKRLASGESAASIGPLAGVPVAIKDNICTDFGRTTCGSRFLEQYESPFSATVVRRLEDAGAVVIGKTNLDEFAMGSSCENSAFHPTRNPWDRTRVPGGSSGGSAAAVAARIVPMALGSDTGGSIRQPAALTNLVGLKPTYGRVSRFGLVAFASSLDQIGPFTRTVADAALSLTVIAGHDPHDSTSAETPPAAVGGEGDFLRDLDRPVAGLRLGVPTQARSPQNHPAVARALESAIAVYRGLGAEIIDIDLPHLSYGIAAYYIVAPAEASSNLARFDGVRYGRRATLKPGEDLLALYCRSRAEGFGPEVQRRIMLGTHVLSSGYYDAFYLTALKARRLIKRDFDNVFSAEKGMPGVHAVLMPTTAGPAFRIGEKANDPLALYLEDIYTVTANLAGTPAVSIPAGFAERAGDDGRDLPLGVQLLGPVFDESRLLRIARMHESATRWHERAPA